METNWDWDHDDFEAPNLLVAEKDETKILEQKQVEDSENHLISDLFNLSTTITTTTTITTQSIKTEPKQITSKEIMRKKNNRKVQENKQKENQQLKAEQQRHNEMYGNAEVDEYTEKYGDVEELYH
jgi:hypothetical protein